MPGERFKVSGVVTPGTERPVYLEHRNGAIWSRVATVQSDSDGSYEFPEARALEGSHFRVALPAINNFGRTHPAVDVAIPGLRIVPQKVSDFSVLPGIVQNGPLAAALSEATGQPEHVEAVRSLWRNARDHLAAELHRRGLQSWDQLV